MIYSIYLLKCGFLMSFLGTLIYWMWAYFYLVTNCSRRFGTSTLKLLARLIYFYQFNSLCFPIVTYSLLEA